MTTRACAIRRGYSISIREIVYRYAHFLLAFLTRALRKSTNQICISIHYAQNLFIQLHTSFSDANKHQTVEIHYIVEKEQPFINKTIIL